MTTEERLAKLEKRLDEFDHLVTYLMTLASRFPMGRRVLQMMAKEGEKCAPRQ